MWQHLTTIAIGGLENIGFAQSGNIIVLSNQGRGIISAVTGEKLFRDNEDWYTFFQEADSSVPGFGTENDTTIKITGMYGEHYLTKTTKDNWHIYHEDAYDGKYPVKNIYIKHPNSPLPIFTDRDGACELRTYGFSCNENILVIALSCNLVIWRRS
ncbi:hypothetical protein SAMN05421788_102135 [Filimonas lacunae]|uniref:Uncharacterized protein n=1 Tax=Filimonas lacunae TaxID=477680 RepID=A0A1N7N2X5_9BACT|nr:hypothetical protein [Filimonas lacunae]SIS92694.1 hypothetical protein SAMN05421788_102135 [Filimonas lacunae]